MKRLTIKVIPNAKKAKILQEGELFKVYVNAPAVDGKANKAVVEVLAEHFNIRKSGIRIIRGQKSREKIIEIAI